MPFRTHDLEVSLQHKEATGRHDTVRAMHRVNDLTFSALMLNRLSNTPHRLPRLPASYQGTRT
jgi:hypothetical protein